MAVIQFENYFTGEDNNTVIHDDTWRAQTFTLGGSAILIGGGQKSVVLKMFRIGSPGDITVSIKATSAGLPTGADLIAATVNGDIFTTDSGGANVQVDFTPTVRLEANTKYAIVFRALTGSGGQEAYSLTDASSPTYSGGSLITSSDAGVNWSAVSDQDCLFQVWGVLADVTMSVTPGVFNLSGADVGLNYTNPGATTYTWNSQAKNNVSTANSSKNNSTVTNQSKNSATVTNQSRS